MHIMTDITLMIKKMTTNKDLLDNIRKELARRQLQRLEEEFAEREYRKAQENFEAEMFFSQKRDAFKIQII